MFALLVAFTSRWTVFDASALRANPNNKRPGLEQQFVQRGEIVAADQTTVLAESVRQQGGIYVREYPLGPLFAPPLGYYDPNNGSHRSRALLQQLARGLAGAAELDHRPARGQAHQRR